jgi:hypothetical protein
MSVSIVKRRLTIPAGTPIHSMSPMRGWQTSKRAITVNAEIAEYGRYVQTTWPGEGGYWRRTVQRDGEYVGPWPLDEWEDRKRYGESDTSD